MTFLFKIKENTRDMHLFTLRRSDARKVKTINTSKQVPVKVLTHLLLLLHKGLKVVFRQYDVAQK